MVAKTTRSSSRRRICANHQTRKGLFTIIMWFSCYTVIIKDKNEKLPKLMSENYAFARSTQELSRRPCPFPSLDKPLDSDALFVEERSVGSSKICQKILHFHKPLSIYLCEVITDQSSTALESFKRWPDNFDIAAFNWGITWQTWAHIVDQFVREKFPSQST